MKNNTTSEKGLNERLSENVNKYRERSGMSIYELSRKSKISVLTVYRIERGWRDSKHIANLRTVARLSHVLNVTPVQLIQ